MSQKNIKEVLKKPELLNVYTKENIDELINT